MRNAAAIVGAALALAGVLLLATPIWLFGLWPLSVGALLTAAIVWETWRYRPILDGPPLGANWRGTAERFLDPESGRMVTVYHNARSGDRAYVAGPDGRCLPVHRSLR